MRVEEVRDLAANLLWLALEKCGHGPAVLTNLDKGGAITYCVRSRVFSEEDKQKTLQVARDLCRSVAAVSELFETEDPERVFCDQKPEIRDGFLRYNPLGLLCRDLKGAEAFISSLRCSKQSCALNFRVGS